MSDASYDMSPEERRELVAEFLSESEGHVQALNDSLLQCEAALKTGKTTEDDVLNAMFRAAHTIKGTASFIGFDKIVSLTHEMEAVLQKVRGHDLILTADLIDTLFSALDAVEALFEGLRMYNEERGEVDNCVQRIRLQLNPVSEAAGAVPQEASPPAEPTEAPAGAEFPPAAPERVSADVLQEVKSNGIVRAYLNEYLGETEQNIIDFNKALLNLENAPPQSTQSKESVRELFRIVHTIKGSSALVHVREVEEIGHRMESCMAAVRDRGVQLRSENISLLFEAIDTVKDILIELKKNKELTIDIRAICGKLDRCVLSFKNESAPPSGSPGVPTAMLAADLLEEDKLTGAEIIILEKNRQNEQDVFLIVIELEQGIAMKSMKALLVHQRLAGRGAVVAIRPDMDMLDACGEAATFCSVLFASESNEREIRQSLSLDGVRVCSIERMEKNEQRQPVSTEVLNQKKGGAVVETVKNIEKEQGASVGVIETSTIRIDSRKLDALMNLSGELVIARAQFARLVSLFEKDVSGLRQVGKSFKEARTSLERLHQEMRQICGVGQDSDPTHTRLQKEMKDLSQRLQVLEREMLNSSDLITRIRMLDETTSSLGKLSSDIQSGVMQTRMIPIEGIFTRFRRIVRDIAKDLNKQVELRVEGEETELDKNIVDKLGDPLTHMIRNAIDHGLEDVASRKANGKPAEGTLLLKAAHKGNTIWISVSDDGRGLDQEKIAEKALTKGLVTQEQLDRMSQEEKFELIFLPGFSTAEKVTNLSGRGVGMDVVKNMINSVNGSITIESVSGEGTTIILKIPLTLAIIQALLVHVGQETYAFPLDAVTEIIRAAPDEIYSVDGNPAVKLRGHVLSLVDFRTVIKIRDAQPRTDSAEKVKIVVITDGSNQLGVMVDSLVGEEEIVIKALSEHFAQVRGISGASLLGDGTVALILDPVAIIKEA